MGSLKPSVLKFGGSSVGTPELIRHVAGRIKRWNDGHSGGTVVVVSAMGDATDDLIELAKAVSPKATTFRYRREMDMLLTTGERVSMALLSMALADLGVEAVSLTGSQAGIVTDESHGEARIFEVKPTRIQESLTSGKVVIVAGFQGVSREKEVTTLGRGGSDTSAVALAVALQAEECVFFKDVEGVYSADPRKVSGAKVFDSMGWDTALYTSHYGAQVLASRCLELAWKHRLKLRVLSTLNESAKGCLIEGEDMLSLEGATIRTVTSKSGLVSLTGPQGIAQLNSELAQKGFKALDLVSTPTEETILFEERYLEMLPSVWRAKAKTGQTQLSVIGAGLVQRPEVLTELMRLAKQSGAQIDMSGLSLGCAWILGSIPNPDALVSHLHRVMVEGSF